MNQRSVEILTRLGLGERINHLPAELSGGQKQRVAIARALVNRPALVLADEPTASLDAESSKIVLDLLAAMADGPSKTTVLLVTHDQRVIDHADRIVNMVGGRIVTNSLTRIAVRICRCSHRARYAQGLPDATLSGIAELHDRRDPSARERRSFAREKKATGSTSSAAASPTLTWGEVTMRSSASAKASA